MVLTVQHYNVTETLLYNILYVNMVLIVQCYIEPEIIVPGGPMFTVNQI